MIVTEPAIKDKAHINVSGFRFQEMCPVRKTYIVDMKLTIMNLEKIGNESPSKQSRTLTPWLESYFVLFSV